MKQFPSQKYSTAGAYCSAYFDEHQKAAATVKPEQLDKAAAVLSDCIRDGGVIFVCGNGGSASISNHFCCDALKTLRSDTSLAPRIMSLASTSPVITAIGNDIGFEEIFAYQLDSMLRPADILVTVSSSGDSENIVRAVKVAKSKKNQVISLTGFGGGRSRNLADVNLHIDCDNYGIIEDIHQSLMHILMQYLRHQEMSLALVEERTF
ncbi:SIS domain-containing protein [Kordiimonas aestuarii]|uniref:SIS domain-containing protein n=1 Tax=Kordiimonas aestuarii TaxID=1005925 RepID=UPI0021D09C3B|nr:SIS domain-containing protein [Kordiimonas aestuarii]